METLPDRTPEPDLHDAGSELSWSQDPAVEAAQKPLGTPLSCHASLHLRLGLSWTVH